MMVKKISSRTIRYLMSRTDSKSSNLVSPLLKHQNTHPKYKSFFSFVQKIKRTPTHQTAREIPVQNLLICFGRSVSAYFFFARRIKFIETVWKKLCKMVTVGKCTILSTQLLNVTIQFCKLLTLCFLHEVEKFLLSRRTSVCLCMHQQVTVSHCFLRQRIAKKQTGLQVESGTSFKFGCPRP